MPLLSSEPLHPQGCSDKSQKMYHMFSCAWFGIGVVTKCPDKLDCTIHDGYLDFTNDIYSLGIVFVKC